MSEADQEQTTATVPRFLLTAGDGYYPRMGNRDWCGFFHSKEEAEAEGKRFVLDKGGPGDLNGFWYAVIDLKSYEVEGSK